MSNGCYMTKTWLAFSW